MTMDEKSENLPDNNPLHPRRRPRYKGTHPRRFEEKYKELDPASFPELQDHVKAQGRTPAGTHVPVLLDEVLRVLDPKPGDVIADCTLGFGGHSSEFIRRIGTTGILVGLDVDAAQLERTRSRLNELSHHANGKSHQIRLHRSHFAGLSKVLAKESIPACDTIFADLGVSSMQIDDPARGFSYKHDGPLDMRVDDRLVRTAADLLATLTTQELTETLHNLADEPDAGKIAELIVQRRATSRLTRTQQLVDIVFEAKRTTRKMWRNRPADQRGQLHPAARTFQTLRILVNDELSGLKQFLRAAPYCLRPGGRIGIICFHSKEDDFVQESFLAGLNSELFSSVASEPLRPAAAEIATNPRARSALFRWAIKTVDCSISVNGSDR